MIKKLEASGRQVYSGLQVSGEPGHCRKEKEPLGELPAVCVFPSKYPSISPAEMSNTPR